MGIVAVFLIAIGLSMDAFAASICLGLSCQKMPVEGNNEASFGNLCWAVLKKSCSLKDFLLPGLYFGFFQAVMPLIGYFLGKCFYGLIKDYDHWLAFILLFLIGFNMIKESRECTPDADIKPDFSNKRLFILAVATSIDALAVGVTFAFFDADILLPCLIIGATTFFVSVFGVKIGQIFGARFKSGAELFGGVILILIGVKILFEHILG